MRLETFVVRIWTGPDAGSASMSPLRQPGTPMPEPGVEDDFHGVVRHVRTGRERRFGDPSELLAFLTTERVAHAPDAQAASEAPDGLDAPGTDQTARPGLEGALG